MSRCSVLYGCFLKVYCMVVSSRCGFSQTVCSGTAVCLEGDFGVPWIWFVWKTFLNEKHWQFSVAAIVAGVWTGVGFSILNNFRTRARIQNFGQERSWSLKKWLRPPLVWASGVQDPDLGVQSGRILGFFGFGLAWISFSICLDPDSVYPHELNCGDAKKLYVK